MQGSLFSAAAPAGRPWPAGPNFADWVAAADVALAAGHPPESLDWQPAEGAWREQRRGDGAGLPPGFARYAAAAHAHVGAEVRPRLYRLLWRLRHGEPGLLDLAADPDVAMLRRWERAVRREAHKTKAFVRFREAAPEVGGEARPRYVAWFEPEHRVLPTLAGFFRRRYATLAWSILTPELAMHYEGEGAVWFGPGASAADAPRGDAFEEAWRVYYRNIFNPARLKIAAMCAEMPRKYWKNLPEAAEIPGLIRAAEARTQAMLDAPAATPALHCGPRPESPGGALQREAAALRPGSLPRLAREAAQCQACPLAGAATQTVFGEGPAQARIVLVGEQPGDAEDLAGRPFVGPAGQLLEGLLAEVGLAREALYLTNAVKHFRYRPQGKRRLHQNPERAHIEACRPWLENELAAIAPTVIVALGATACEALLGRRVALADSAGQRYRYGAATLLLAPHPAALLRAPAAQAAALHSRLRGSLALAGRLAGPEATPPTTDQRPERRAD